MNEKFNIRYLIGSSEKDALKRLTKIEQYKRDVYVSPDGWISIQIGDYEFGFIPEDDSADGLELLDSWFDSFKTVYEELQKSSRVMLEYWEEPGEYFIFEKANGNVSVQYYEKIFPVKNGRLILTETSKIKLTADVVILENDFFNLIKSKVNEFWLEVGKLNSVLEKYVEHCKID